MRMIETKLETSDFQYLGVIDETVVQAKIIQELKLKKVMAINGDSDTSPWKI